MEKSCLELAEKNQSVTKGPNCRNKGTVQKFKGKEKL